MIEIVLVLLTGVIFGAINFGFFCFGYFIRSKKKEEKKEEGLTVTEENEEMVKGIADFLNYNGGK